MRAYFSVLLFGILALTSAGLGQSMTFSYFDDSVPPAEPPITNGGGAPVPDGTTIRIVRDLGSAGPDSTDQILISAVFNGENLGLGAGYFSLDPVVADIGTSLYLLISPPGLCWHSVDVPVVPGYGEHNFAANEWTSTPPPCLNLGLPPAVAHFYYCWDSLGVILACPCANGSPIPDGTVACYFHDVNGNGPDGADVSLQCSASSYYTPGCWAPETPLTTEVPSAGWQVYVSVNGGFCCWTTRDYWIMPGDQDFVIISSDWNCAGVACGAAGVGQRPSAVPEAFRFAAAYPNPFNSIVRIDLAVPVSGIVTVEIYNLSGQRVGTLINDFLPAGVQHLTWDARSLSSGLYLCRAAAGTGSITKKLLLLR